MDKKNLTLTNPENKKFECRKISDEYDADKVIDASLLKPEDIAGVYKDGDLAIEINKTVENLLTYTGLSLKIQNMKLRLWQQMFPLKP